MAIDNKAAANARKVLDLHGGIQSRGESIGATPISVRQIQFLSLKTLPAVLYDFEAAWFLGCHVDDIPSLVNAGLLRALGSAGEDESKRFSREMLYRIAASEELLSAITDTIYNRRQAAKGVQD